MNLIKTSLFALAAAVMMTSCDSDDPTSTYVYQYKSDFSYVTDLQTGSTEVLDAAEYDVEFDVASGAADIVVSNLKYSSSKPATKLHIESTFRQNEERALVVNVPSATSVAGSYTHQVTDFHLAQSAVQISAVGQMFLFYDIYYVVDGRYAVRAVQTHVVLAGSTVVTPVGSAEGKTDRQPFYSYVLNPSTSTADLVIYNLNDGKTTYPQLLFEKLPYSVGANGVSINVTDKLTAKQSASTAKAFVINGLKLDARYNSSTRIEFATDETEYAAKVSYLPKDFE